MDYVIQTENLTKTFRKKVAVSDLSLEVPKGSIYAFLGPNGAGKTTTIKLLMNLLFPSSGSAKVLGVPSGKLGPGVLQKVGYVSENQKLPKWMTVRQMIDFCRPMYPDWDDSFCEHLLRQLDLQADCKIGSMSRGMKVKAALLTSLAYRPELLVLDEPFSGLDPLVRDEFIRGILELTRSEGWTVFISSHDIDEVDRLADWVGFIDQGRLRVSQKRDDLLDRFRRVEVMLSGGLNVAGQFPGEWLLPEQSAHAFRFVDSRYDSQQLDGQVKSIFADAESVEVHALSLREVYLALARYFRGGGEGGAL